MLKLVAVMLVFVGQTPDQLDCSEAADRALGVPMVECVTREVAKVTDSNEASTSLATVVIAACDAVFRGIRAHEQICRGDDAAISLDGSLREMERDQAIKKIDEIRGARGR
ncbi:MAG: hypothetical protein JWR80_9919 [Bradyrhizobium sp.]|nr:hypothetical protein [Bradyrhizobium sp.]